MVYGKVTYLSSLAVMQKDDLSCQTVKLSFAAAYWNYKCSLGYNEFGSDGNHCQYLKYHLQNIMFSQKLTIK